MTEAQLMTRRALQEALDRRDNGGAPTAVSGYGSSRHEDDARSGASE